MGPADGVYDPNAPGAPPYQFDKGPWQSNEERLCGVALAAATAPAEMLREIRPWDNGHQLPDPAAPHQAPWTPQSIFVMLDRNSAARLDASSGGGGYGGTSTPSTSWW